MAHVRVPEAQRECREVGLPVRLQLPPLLLAAAELAERVGHHVLLEPHMQGEVPAGRAGGVVLREGRVQHVVAEQLLVHFSLHRAHLAQPLDQQGACLLELRDELESVEVASASQPLQCNSVPVCCDDETECVNVHVRLILLPADEQALNRSLAGFRTRGSEQRHFAEELGVSI